LNAVQFGAEPLSQLPWLPWTSTISGAGSALAVG
jgi:hypothetical protein